MKNLLLIGRTNTSINQKSLTRSFLVSIIDNLLVTVVRRFIHHNYELMLQSWHYWK